MGQYWQVINLDKRQTLGDWYKLGECLFDTTPDVLVGLLEQPIASEASLDRHSHSSSLVEKFWIGDRIICLGDYHEDLPIGLLSQSEQAELDKAELDEAELNEAGDSDGGNGMNLFLFAENKYYKPEYRYHDHILTKNSQLRVLRNLSKHEYVREMAIKVDGIDHGYYPSHAVGFGEVVLSRISWSTSNSCGMAYNGDIHRGVWAGDRFDITTVDQIELADGGIEWTDISREVATEMSAIWVSEYGPEWLEHRV